MAMIAYPESEPGRAPLLISLPHGLDLGGVTTWALRLANGLAAEGRAVALVAHPRLDFQPLAKFTLHPCVELIEPKGWPHMRDISGDLSPFIPVYRDAVRRMAEASGSPVVVSPNILGDSYGIAAALCLSDPEITRVIGWQHTDSAYDTCLLRRYETVISRYIAINAQYMDALRPQLPGRAADITTIPHGVAIPREPTVREPRARTGRPLRLIYTGRIEHQQKRVTAYPALSRELTRRGIDHEILLVGDGPAAAELDGLIKATPRVRRLGLASPEEVTAWLDWADAFVLASRFEGLCISRIEAMARGCVPIVTVANSGAGEGIADGVSGFYADAKPDDSDEAVAVSLANSVQRYLAADADRVSAAAWRAARQSFSLDRHIKAVASLLDDAAAGPARHWPASWPCAFTAAAGQTWVSGSTPPGGVEQMRALLDSLADRSVVLHGAGRHTVDMAPVLAASRARILAVCDDDQGRWGSTLLGWPVLGPADAARTGATDVIISSWMHAQTIWKRRAMYEDQGLRVHKIYG
jgi:glycosyltransferase involved in cell wall biosynthesis